MTQPAAPAPIRTNTLAIIGFVGAFMIPVVGIVLGAMAQSQIARTQEEGRGLARWAVGIGVVGTVAQVAFFIVWLTLFFSFATQTPMVR